MEGIHISSKIIRPPGFNGVGQRITATDRKNWQLRKPYFDGAKRYKIAVDNGEQLEFDADEFGLFELEGGDPSVPIAIFAKRVKAI